MRGSVLLAFALAFVSRGAAASSLPGLIPAQTQKQKQKTKKAKAKKPPKTPPLERKDEVAPPPTPPPQEDAETQRVEAAKKKLELERRKESKVTPGTASRWSNKGAMVPVESAVPVTAELPIRAVPIDAGVETPGQRLTGPQDETVSARLSFSGYHLQTEGQQKFVPANESANYLVPELAQGNRNIDFLRARATMGYQQIAGSDFSLRLDAEYRPHIAGSRFTDWRINELYASYGLTEHTRTDPAAPWWGVALGRLAIREAGYAQADGLAVRFRVADWLKLGAFGGVTGNPYGYNWSLRRTQVLSADWITGGAFVGVTTSDLILNVGGVVTFARIGCVVETATATGGEVCRLADGSAGVNRTGIDRVYLSFDAAYLIIPELNVVLNGWIDLIGGQVIQNLDGSINWSPTNDLSLTLGGGRFSTVLYKLSTGYAYAAPGTNLWNEANLGPLVGVDGEVVIPYDAVLETTSYNNVRLRGAYRILRELEASVRFDVLIRDAGANQDDLQADAGATRQPSALRMLPGATLRYRNPSIADLNAGFTYIVDKESQADAVVNLGLGRGFFGLYLGGDFRYFFGEIDGFDGGVSLSFTFPREWFPGTLIIRGMFHYYRENLSLFVPVPGSTMQVENIDGSGGVTGWNTIQNQESFLGFGGIEWRL